MTPVAGAAAMTPVLELRGADLVRSAKLSAAGAIDPVIEESATLVYHAALLSGVGARSIEAARTAARSGRGPGSSPAGDGRTCIDGGGRHVFGLLATGARHLRMIARSGPARDGVLPWTRSYYYPHGVTETWVTETYLGEQPAGWSRARRIAAWVGQSDAFQQAHRVLGPHGHIYSVDWVSGQSQPSIWIGWQLDRTLTPDQALARLDYADAWPRVSSFWTALLGATPDPRRSGPWSVRLAFGGPPRLRVGSTNWLRHPEGEGKRRRLISLVEQYGGDRRFAESLYKLIESAVPTERRRPVGRAVEFEISATHGDSAEFFLCAS